MMKRFLAFLMALTLLASSCAFAQTGWNNGEFTLGEGGYKLVLPSNMQPVEAYHNELAAAMTQSYVPPDGMGIVVYSSKIDAQTEAKQQYEVLLVMGSGQTDPSNIYAVEKSENALAEWTATFHSGKPTEYCETGVLSVNGAELPYVFSFNNQVRADILQAIMVFMVPGKTQCYPIYVSRLFSINGKATLARVEECRSILLGSVDAMILPTAENTEGLENLQHADTIPYVLETEKLSEENRILALMYNATLDHIAENARGGITTGATYTFNQEDENALLRSSAIMFNNSYATRTGKWSNDKNNTAEALDYFWEKTVDFAVAAKTDDHPFGVTNEDVLTGGDVRPVELMTKLNSELDAILFSLQDAEGNWAEDCVYLLVRIMTGDETILCLVNDQAAIAEYLTFEGTDIGNFKP